MILIVIVLALIALGVAHLVRQQVRRSREALERVDRSKLRDLNRDGWDDDWDRDRDDSGRT